MVATLLVVWAGLGAVGESFQADPAPPPAQKAGGSGQRVLAQSTTLPVNLVTRQHTVIRDGKMLADAMGTKDEASAEAAVAKLLSVKGMDWSKQMLIVLSGGAQVTGGYKIEVKQMEVNKDTLTIRWKVQPPGPDQVVIQALSHPVLMFLTERFPGTVQFDPAKAPVAPRAGT